MHKHTSKQAHWFSVQGHAREVCLFLATHVSRPLTLSLDDLQVQRTEEGEPTSATTKQEALDRREEHARGQAPTHAYVPAWFPGRMRIHRTTRTEKNIERTSREGQEEEGLPKAVSVDFQDRARTG